MQRKQKNFTMKRPITANPQKEQTNKKDTKQQNSSSHSKIIQK